MTHHAELIKRRLLHLTVTIIAFCIFVGMYGLSIVNPSYTDWLMVGGDGTQHYLGAEAFLNSRWFFPIGMADTLSYPKTASVIFTDSIPLFALFFKLFAGMLPSAFQYMGLWGLLCYVLQGNLAVNLLYKYSKDYLVVSLGAILFMLSPIMTMRFYGHESLGGHWLILLAGHLLVYYKERYARIKPALLIAGVLGLLVPMVHLYFLIGCGIVIACYALYDVMSSKKVYRAIAVVGCYIIAALVSIVLLGGFGQGDTLTWGFGFYSFNLNGFMNSMGNSLLVPSLACGPGQYEGFSYLGISQLLLFSVAVFWYIAKYKARDYKLLTTCIVLGIVCLFVASSNTITAGNTTLCVVPLPGWIIQKWAIFRATGRFIWPLYYLIVLFALVGTQRLIKNRRALVLLLSVCVMLQVYELYPMYSTKNKNNIVYESGLHEETWENIVAETGAKHLVLIGEGQPDRTLEKIEYQLTKFALDHDLTINRFWMVHGLYEENSSAIIEEAIHSGESGNLYILTDQSLCISYPELEYYLLDGYIIGVCDSDVVLDLPSPDEFSISFISQYMTEGEDIDGNRYLHEGGVSYGPYIPLKKGRYKVIIDGTGLANCYMDINSNENIANPTQNTLEYHMVYSSDIRVVFELTLHEHLSDIEIRVYNLSPDTVCLQPIQVQPLD